MHADSSKIRNGITFEKWSRQVDKVLVSICGIDQSGLADGDSWSAWDNGDSPAEYAHDLLSDQDFPFEE